MQPIKALARRSLRALNLERVRHPSFVDLMHREGIETVLDVGANHGHFGAEIREHGFRGRIISFEPGAQAFAGLLQRSAGDPVWEAHHMGLGNAEGELELSVSRSDVFSSFKAPSDYTSKKFKGAQEERRERVPVKRLDDFLAGRGKALAGSTYLKIDTQGFEQEVLEGAGSLLSTFCVIQMELPLRRLYEGQMSFIDTAQWMQGKGFEIGMAKENGFDWQDCRLLELDVAFVRSADAHRRRIVTAT